MCGIIGVRGKVNQSFTDHLRRLTHRGPDHQDMLQVGGVHLGHTRLAIVDVADGQQPMQSADGRYWLVSNGEIYNHRELRERFQDYPFQTQSDNEILIPLYARYGVELFEHVNGMFAFALYDEQEDVLLLARDPIGIKPLYYGHIGDALAFASELKSLHDRVNNLREMPPGHYLFNGEMHKYFDLRAISPDVSYSISVQDVRKTLTEAVEKRLMADVPLGVYLSGGLDSTVVAAIVAERIPNVHSFAVGVEGSHDIQHAREAAKALGTQHHEYIYDAEEILQALPDIIYHLESFDPSLVRSAIPNYFLARMTSQYVTVVLTGEGADELFAGYHYLKELNDQALRDELIALTESLHNCNLQRCDRMTMAHSIEARVPFLDVDVIRLAMHIPTELKIDPETQTEKWILREAFRDIVPENVLWRRKEQFSQGAGSNSLMVELADRQIDDQTFENEKKRIFAERGIDILSKEMLLYYLLFVDKFSSSLTSVVRVWRGVDV